MKANKDPRVSGLCEIFSAGLFIQKLSPEDCFHETFVFQHSFMVSKTRQKSYVDQRYLNNRVSPTSWQKYAVIYCTSCLPWTVCSLKQCLFFVDLLWFSTAQSTAGTASIPRKLLCTFFWSWYFPPQTLTCNHSSAPYFSQHQFTSIKQNKTYWIPIISDF